MLEIQDGLTMLTVDVEATRRLYALRSAGDNCKCHGCVWFAARREDAYPRPFRVLLKSLGIDVSLPNEVMTHGDDFEKRRPPILVEAAFDFVGTFRQAECADRGLPGCVPGAFRYRFCDGWGMPRQRDTPAGFNPISNVAFEWLPGAA
jgi:hypothetical protein